MEMKINGFVFNSIGDLVDEPEVATLELLEDTLAQLYHQREYISASRIQRRISIILDSEMFLALSKIRPNLTLFG
ncbi:hypothetical protein AB4562_04605 [Vibrio sp. 10N.222.54.A1]|uniref:hypothetical protein n=1 Tax=unclassified Vibrio TaxID=2614977 RepID=UPI00355437BD